MCPPTVLRNLFSNWVIPIMSAFVAVGILTEKKAVIRLTLCYEWFYYIMLWYINATCGPVISRHFLGGIQKQPSKYSPNKY